MKPTVNNCLRLLTATALTFVLLPAACQQQMARQPSYKPLDPSDFFSDSRSARPLVPGTVARGHLRSDTHLFTGLRTQQSQDWSRPAAIVGTAVQDPISALALVAGRERDYVDTFPFPVTADVLKQGRDRYQIYCVLCHDPLGTGR